MGLPIFDKSVSNLTHIPRKIGFLPERAKSAKGVGSIVTGNKEKKRSILTQDRKSRGSELT